VPAQLIDGFKHTIYLYVITGISNELSTIANSQTSYNLGTLVGETPRAKTGLLK